jgi:hypothetical protein
MGTELNPEGSHAMMFLIFAVLITAFLLMLYALDRALGAMSKDPNRGDGLTHTAHTFITHPCWNLKNKPRI